jgi:AraC family transcriptional regulator
MGYIGGGAIAVEAARKALTQNNGLHESAPVSRLAATVSGDWVPQIIRLLDAAVMQLHRERAAYSTLLEAASLLRRQIAPRPEEEMPDGRGRLLVWQARKVLDYIDAHITGSVRITHLCDLIQRSEAHFSRSFKRTFGESPRAFVIRRRLELAAQYMLDTDASLSDISVRCGFTDQAHLSKQFRQVTGKTPASWRRARRVLPSIHSMEFDIGAGDNTRDDFSPTARGMD